MLHNYFYLVTFTSNQSGVEIKVTLQCSSPVPGLRVSDLHFTVRLDCSGDVFSVQVFSSDKETFDGRRSTMVEKCRGYLVNLFLLSILIKYFKFNFT